MSWRVVIVSQRCKLEYKLGYLICRGEETKKVFISEISTLVIESVAASMTTALLCELIKNKVNVIFCDEKHNPISQLNGLYGRHDCSGILKKQLLWKEQNKLLIWTEIVRLKIFEQKIFLEELESSQKELLEKYINELQLGDISNREGLSSKVYFDVLFGLKFKRGEMDYLNGALNYGYSILLSAFKREIVADGYNTQIGFAHKNEFNFYNLSCDLMEPFRVLVDRIVFCTDNIPLSSDYKHDLCNVLNRIVKINGICCPVLDAIGIYCKSIFNAVEVGDVSLIKNYEL